MKYQKEVFVYTIISMLIFSSLLSLIPTTYIKISTDDSNIRSRPITSGPEINITSPEENTTYISPSSGYYPATYNFENDAIGSKPAGWTFGESGGVVSIISELEEHKKIIQLNDTSTASGDTGTVYARQDFGARSNGTIEFWVHVSKLDQYLGIYIHQFGSPEGNSIYIGMGSDGNIQYHDGTWHIIDSYSPNQWQHVKITFDCADNWHIWRNGISIDNGAGYSFWNSPADLRFLTFKTGSTSTSYAYVDSVGYSWDSNYDLGDNYKEGLLLNYTYLFANPADWFGYSLDGTANKTIIGNKTIPVPSNGNHTIQVFGNETITGTMYNSEIINFTINIYTPSNPYTPPNGDEQPDLIWVIVVLIVIPSSSIAVIYIIIKKKKNRN